MPTALVTGANRGIGLSFVKALIRRGYDVIACCRSSSPELEATGARVEPLDVTSDADVASLADRLRGTRIDLLVNNAGILRRNRLDDLDFDSLRAQYEVNALGPLRVTAALRGSLARGSKVAIVTSRMGSIDDNTSGGSYGYRMSKAAVNAAGKSLSVDLAPAGVAIALLHPGWVRTSMTGGAGNWGPDDAVAGMLDRIDALNLDNTGSFWHADGTPLPW